TKERFGDLRFFSRSADQDVAGDEGEASAVPEGVREAAFGIETVGKVHRELVRTDAGYHIVKLTGRRAALRRTLDEARRPIQNRLWREKRERSIEQFLAKLRAGAELEEHWDALSEVQVAEPSAADQVPMPTGHEGHGHGEGAVAPDDAP